MSLALDAQQTYDSDGFVVLPNLFSKEEVSFLRDHYMEMRNQEWPGDFAGVDLASSDPLKRYPRMIHMHRWDEVSLRWLLDFRINAALTALLGEEPYAVQTMLYFKPAGGRGQALHQDQTYLNARPGTCIAAWLALDDCDEENGCMQVVPRTQNLPMLCTVAADTSASFTDVTVPLGPEMVPLSVNMKAGDVLFFNGSVIHGSYPNTSRDRFRRSLIGHYITGNAQAVAGYYHPVLKMNGEVVDLSVSTGGGPCGVWSTDGIEMVSREIGQMDLHE